MNLQEKLIRVLLGESEYEPSQSPHASKHLLRIIKINIDRGKKEKARGNSARSKKFGKQAAKAIAQNRDQEVRRADRVKNMESLMGVRTGL